MSKHEITVIKVPAPQPHGNADNLEIIQVWGYQCVVGKGQFKEGSLAAYIPPDYVVPLNQPEFEFLKKQSLRENERITVRKFRGVISMGLLIPARDGWIEGQDVMEELGIYRYEPRIKDLLLGTEKSPPEPGPTLYVPKYDIENLLRYPDVFQDEEPVYVTEKIHGANARYVFTEDRMWVGSRTQWKPHNGLNVWSRVIEQHPEIETWCREHPNHILFGEVYGEGVQEFNYGLPPRHFGFAAFDVMFQGRFFNPEEFVLGVNPIFVAPATELGWIIKYNLDELKQVIEKDSAFGAGMIREGVVVKPVVERTHHEIGRVVLKLVSNRYLSKGK